jgi:hypothetical protein
VLAFTLTFSLSLKKFIRQEEKPNEDNPIFQEVFSEETRSEKACDAEIISESLRKMGETNTLCLYES